MSESLSLLSQAPGASAATAPSASLWRSTAMYSTYFQTKIYPTDRSPAIAVAGPGTVRVGYYVVSRVLVCYASSREQSVLAQVHLGRQRRKSMVTTMSLLCEPRLVLTGYGAVLLLARVVCGWGQNMSCTVETWVSSLSYLSSEPERQTGIWFAWGLLTLACSYSRRRHLRTE